MTGLTAGLLIGALAGLTGLLLLAEHFRDSNHRQTGQVEEIAGQPEHRPPADVIPMFADRRRRS